MQKLLCFSKLEFDKIMSYNNIYDGTQLPENVCVISIGSPWNESFDCHWFKIDYENVLNLDFDDCGPAWENTTEDYYDIAQEMLDHQDRFFNYSLIPENDDKFVNLKAMNYIQSNEVVKFIEDHKDFNFLIHCNAGASRSQGIVRYILDVYGEDNFETRKSNPCITPNMHVVRMLKRSYRNLILNQI